MRKATKERLKKIILSSFLFAISLRFCCCHKLCHILIRVATKQKKNSKPGKSIELCWGSSYSTLPLPAHFPVACSKCMNEAEHAPKLNLKTE